MTARRLLRLVAAILGAAIVLIGLLHIALGPAIIRGAGAFSASLDSEDRFFGAVFAGYGAAWIWCAMDVAGRSRFIAALAAIFLLGGIARLLSLLVVGWPDPLYVVLAGVELALPLAIVLLLRRAGTPVSQM